MPAAQAVQTVSKAYVDQAISELTQSLLTASGGTLSGPLYLSGDPTQSLQAADKHYVDVTTALAVPLAGGSMTGALTAPAVNGVESPAAGSAQTTLQSAVTAAGSNGAVSIPPSYAGTDTFTNTNGVYVTDLRSSKSQQSERSVKEFGAVCDGLTDDTNALQSALNYANTHGVALTIPQGTCKTQALNWHGESIGGMGKQVSVLMGFPGQDVLATATDSVNLLSYTRIHDLTIYVDQSLDASCSPAKGRASAGVCAENRPLESNSILSPGGNGLTGAAGTGAGWSVGNCAIAMPAATGAGGNGLRVAEIENVEIAATGVDPMAAQYSGAHSTHTCGMYLAQWPQWSEFRNIDIRGLNTGIAIPALPAPAPSGLNSDSNRWQNITIAATHGFTADAGSNNVLDNIVVVAGNSSATGEPPTGLVLNLANTQQGWTVRNSVVMPVWNAVAPSLSVTASGGAVTAVTVGSEQGLGFDPYGTQVPLKFSGSCTAQATASVNSNGSIGAVTVAQGGVGCAGTTTASINEAGTWDTAAPVNLIAGQNMSFFSGNLLKGNGGYTVWNAAASQSYGTQLGAGGGTLPGGGSYAALVVNNAIGGAYQVEQFPGADFGAKLQACLGTVNSVYGGTCDARNFTGTLSMGSNLTVSTGNTTVLLPCATISTASQLIVTAGTRNVALRGCALRGASTGSGSQGGTVFLYSGTGAMVQVGDPTYAVNTMGFHLENVAINTTAASSGTAQGVVAYRTQEMDLASLYFLGNSNQTGMTLDGTGNYTGGSFYDNEFSGFQTAVNAVGHQIANPATTDWMNASTFVRLHIDCPTSGGNPISGTYGINLQQGDGNTFTGGDVEGCSTALHLGTNAQNNTIVGLRNENSSSQVVADVGSSYNNWMTGGTMFTGQLTDNGTRNSFLDSFHRSFNGMNGDWYGSQKDGTVTNHYRLGIGAGNERGMLDRYQTDYGYRWTIGLSDAAAGAQSYQVLDELNNVYRLSIGQYNNGQSSTNNQTVINAAGTGAVVLNGSNNAGTGGVVFGSGGASETTVATIDKGGNAQFSGTLQVAGAATLAATPTVKNQADAEIDTALWAGLTTSQKESFIYKDWNGNSQWYMVKDASNNWALNSAIGGLDSFKAYQSTNSGDTYIDASNTSGVVRINYESGSGTGFNIYGGNSSTLYASFTGTTAIKFPGLAATTGHNCLQVDNSGFISNTGSACGAGGTSGTVNAGTSGQIAYYSSNGTVLAGTSTVAVASGGTGSANGPGALANLGGLSLTQTAAQTMAGALNVPILEGTLNADQRQSPLGTGNNGISMSITQCASQSYACMIQAPALYAQTEAQPFGGAPNAFNSPIVNGPTSSQPVAGFLDQRYGVPQWIFNQSQPVNNRFMAEPTFAMNNITGPGQGLSAHFANALELQNIAFNGGRNSNNLTSGLGDKTNFGTLGLQSFKYTQTQGGGDLAQSVYCIGTGDCVGHAMDTVTYGGPNTIADEGNESTRFSAIEGGQVFSASIATVTKASDGSVTFTTTSQSNNGYQGEGRLLIDTTKVYNGAANGSYIASIATSGGNEVVACGGTCNWDSSFGDSVQTILNTAIGNGASSTNTFPQSNVTLQVASSTGFTVGNLACIFDYDYECEKITAVGTGTVTIATDRLPHLVGAYVTTGGMAGFSMEFEADRVVPGSTNGITTNPDSGLVSTVRNAIPILYNSSGNVLTLFEGGGTLPGALGSYTGRAYSSMGSGGTVTLTVSGGYVTACLASGGSGYSTNYPPQISISGNWTTAPTVWINGTSGGALSSCAFTAGIAVTSATATVVPVNPYDIYPTTKVTGVYDAAAGAVDGTLYADPPSGSFAPGDSIEEPHYFWQHIRGSNNVAGAYIPSLTNAANSGYNVTLTGIWQGNDTGIGITNSASPAIYRNYPGGTPWMPGLGQLAAPYGIQLTGVFSNGMQMSTPPVPTGAGGVVAVRCGSIGCANWTNSYYVAQLSNSYGGYDGLLYQPSNGVGSWTSTNSSGFTAGWTASPGQYASLNVNNGASTYKLQLLNAGTLSLPSGQNLTTAQHVAIGPSTSTAGDAACYSDALGTLSDCGTASGMVTSFAAPSSGWPSWMVPTVTTPTTTPSMGVTVSAIPNTSLANSYTTVNGLTCTLGSACTVSASAGTLTGSSLASGVTGSSLTSVGTITSGTWQGTPVANNYLANSSTTVNGQACALGGSCTITAVTAPNAFTALTDGSAVTLATGGAGVVNATLTLAHTTATRALNVTGLASGANITVVLKQDSTGGAALTFGTGCTWYLGTNAGFAASTTPALTSAANAINILAVLYDGTNCYANVR
jgi:hypothetical protein